MVRTRVGYSGGVSNNPSYYNIGSHAETAQVDYDPTVISYEELLNVFWREHNPTYPAFSGQYRSVILYHNEEQKRLALESMEREEARRGEKIYTDIVPFSAFYLAEDYHQKYYLRASPDLLTEFDSIYPDLNSLVNSTAVTRVNGYLGGYGTLADLEKQLRSLGLSSAGAQRLLEIGKARLANNSPACPLP